MVHAFQNGVWLQRPWMTALSFSAGKQSTCILHMVLRGDMERPKNFVVLNADPGMENSRSYEIVREMEERCVEAGIPFIRTARSLYEELLALKASGATRFDTPPFWTKNRDTGRRGRLMQGGTGAYKVAPMYRELRKWMQENIGVSAKTQALGTDAVRMMIGFSNDEWMRIKEDKREYVEMVYPLIDMKMGEREITAYYLKNNLPIPPRSVCNACFANDVSYFKAMYLTRPHDWKQAVAIDEACRDLTCIGVRDECYVSWTLVPLTELAERGFPEIDGEKEAMQCHSGYCFT